MIYGLDNIKSELDEITNYIRETDDGDGIIDLQEFKAVMIKVFYAFKKLETNKYVKISISTNDLKQSQDIVPLMFENLK